MNGRSLITPQNGSTPTQKKNLWKTPGGDLWKSPPRAASPQAQAQAKRKAPTDKKTDNKRAKRTHEIVALDEEEGDEEESETLSGFPEVEPENEEEPSIDDGTLAEEGVEEEEDVENSVNENVVEDDEEEEEIVVPRLAASRSSASAVPPSVRPKASSKRSKTAEEDPETVKRRQNAYDRTKKSCRFFMRLANSAGLRSILGVFQSVGGNDASVQMTVSNEGLEGFSYDSSQTRLFDFSLGVDNFTDFKISSEDESRVTFNIRVLDLLDACTMADKGSPVVVYCLDKAIADELDCELDEHGVLEVSSVRLDFERSNGGTSNNRITTIKDVADLRRVLHTYTAQAEFVIKGNEFCEQAKKYKKTTWNTLQLTLCRCPATPSTSCGFLPPGKTIPSSSSSSSKDRGKEEFVFEIGVVKDNSSHLNKWRAHSSRGKIDDVVFNSREQEISLYTGVDNFKILEKLLPFWNEPRLRILHNGIKIKGVEIKTRFDNEKGKGVLTYLFAPREE